MRIGFMDSEGNKTIIEASVVSLEATSKNTPIVWIMTDDAGDTYFSKDPNIIDNFDKIFDGLLKNGYADLSDYLVYIDPGYDEEDEEAFGDDDDGDDDGEDDDSYGGSWTY